MFICFSISAKRKRSPGENCLLKILSLRISYTSWLILRGLSLGRLVMSILFTSMQNPTFRIYYIIENHLCQGMLPLGCTQNLSGIEDGWRTSPG